MSRTLYVTDLDGTLLGSDSRISERSGAIISELSRRGALITVATARTPATVVHLLEGIYTRPDAIVMTGAARWQRQPGVFADVHLMPVDDVDTALTLCARCRVHPFVYTLSADNRHMHVYHAAAVMSKAEANFYNERARLALKTFHNGTHLPPAQRHNTILLYAVGHRADVEQAADYLRQHTECSVFCYPDIFNDKIANLEVFAPGVSKANAVLSLKTDMGADRLVVFGDNLNDIPMLKAADVAVAVGNALDDVKACAHEVIEPNYTDSVARFIFKDYEDTISDNTDSRPAVS